MSLPEVTPEAAVQIVQNFGLQLAAEVDAPLLVNGFGSFRRCDGANGERPDDVYYLSMGYQLRPAAETQKPFVVRKHQELQAAGWRIVDFRELPDGGATLIAKRPDDDFGLSIDAHAPKGTQGAWIGLSVDTPCYQNPQGAIVQREFHYKVRDGLDFHYLEPGEPVPLPSPSTSPS